MAVAKSKGARFGNPNLPEMNRTRKRQSKEFCDGVAPIVMPLRNRGLTFKQIAETLNEMNLKTARGSNYFPTTVKRIVERTQMVVSV